MSVDPKGYYAVLGVQTSASATEIKRAFRRRAIQLHPDRNTSPHAVNMFLLLKEAYETLSNVSRRAAYDIWETTDDSGDTDTPSREPDNEPIVCSKCSKITAQPRYVIFLRVKSYLVGTSRTSSQGIFCSDCAAKEAIRVTFTTWALGWWCLPFGPIYAAHAVIRNTFGGIKPKDINVRIAAHQAWHFVSIGQVELARAVAADALKLASGKTPEVAELKASVLRVLDLGARESPPRRLKNPWRLLRRPFFVQAVPLLIIATVGTNLVWGAVRPAAVPTPAPVASTQPPPPPPTAPAPDPTDARRSGVRYRRPLLADNGEPWPTVPAYLPGYPKRFTEGRSTLTVDNSQNDSDVFAKLFTDDGTSRVLARAFFIPAGGTFTVESLERGRYDLRYRLLDSGTIVKSDPMEFKEISIGDATKVTTMNVTLYKVAGSSLRIQPIPPDEFD